ncbi:hypothetical protein IRT45_13730 [Nocardia sp. BSTN01]|uniref:hypothetical protein n=1 Tax=Nocardia sp. BSTN01 TaxID=2783665 RepID=UPI00188EFC0F|nr:hypothetical protein [Nocardia sp. BSTN01]MBF4998212.1 hypothetical protein [Nocardia sp. BSTN01]
MTSWRARAVIARMRWQRNKRFYADPAVMRARLAEHQAPRRSRPPQRLARRCDIAHRTVDGRSVYTFTPLGSPMKKIPEARRATDELVASLHTAAAQTLR